MLRVLKQIVTSVPHPAWPHVDRYTSLKDRTCALEDLTGQTRGIIDEAEPTAYQATAGHSSYGDPPEPIRSTLIPVAPQKWTNLCSDYVLAHLVSLFLALINPYWRLVERDLFTSSLKNGGLFCSVLLVHAIMSCASVCLIPAIG